MQSCPTCRSQKWMCICDEITKISLKTSVALVVHFREAHKASNTAKLFTLGINETDWAIYGKPHEPLHVAELITPNHRNLVLFPTADSVCLEDLPPHPDLPDRLIIPDGSWKQAARIASKFQGYPDIQFVKLSSVQNSQYRLRNNPHPEKICTFEAGLEALKILEPQGDYSQMEHLFRVMVDRQMWIRGKISEQEIYGGLPKRPGGRKTRANLDA